MNTNLLLKINRITYITFFIITCYWFLIHEAQEYSLTFTLLWCLPITLPILGVLQGKPNSYSWLCFGLCLYLCYEIMVIWVDEELRFPFVCACMLTTTLFITSAYYAKYKRLELKKPK